VEKEFSLEVLDDRVSLHKIAPGEFGTHTADCTEGLSLACVQNLTLGRIDELAKSAKCLGYGGVSKAPDAVNKTESKFESRILAPQAQPSYELLSEFRADNS
jgi:hypothetical protein